MQKCLKKSGMVPKSQEWWQGIWNINFFRQSLKITSDILRYIRYSALQCHLAAAFCFIIYVDWVLFVWCWWRWTVFDERTPVVIVIGMRVASKVEKDNLIASINIIIRTNYHQKYQLLSEYVASLAGGLSVASLCGWPSISGDSTSFYQKRTENWELMVFESPTSSPREPSWSPTLSGTGRWSFISYF